MVVAAVVVVVSVARERNSEVRFGGKQRRKRKLSPRVHPKLDFPP